MEIMEVVLKLNSAEYTAEIMGYSQLDMLWIDSGGDSDEDWVAVATFIKDKTECGRGVILSNTVSIVDEQLNINKIGCIDVTCIDKTLTLNNEDARFNQLTFITVIKCNWDRLPKISKKLRGFL